MSLEIIRSQREYFILGLKISATPSDLCNYSYQLMNFQICINFTNEVKMFLKGTIFHHSENPTVSRCYPQTTALKASEE